MKLVVLGLSLTSSWGNGHATTWRALLDGWARRGHDVLFLERDMPWYAAHRDLEPSSLRPGIELRLYDGLPALEREHARAVADADAVILGSYVPDGIAAGHWLADTARGLVAFYDIDTPLTLQGLAAGGVDYVSADLLARLDLYLSFTGGPILSEIEGRFAVPAARALHCSVDAMRWRPVDAPERWAMGYLGTWSADRQPKLDALMLAPARALPDEPFVVAGPLYPPEIDWPPNVGRLEHVAPPEHAAFYASQRLTLNVTRDAMATAGWSPSVRLFEAAACGVAIVSDRWPGLDTLLQPGAEILLVDDGDEVLGLLTGLPEARRRAIGAAARRRILLQHTGTARAAELESHLEAARIARARRQRCRPARRSSR